MAAYALGAAGVGVVEAASAEEGLPRDCARRPSVILCDRRMPAHDRHEFLRWVRDIERATGRSTPAAAFTAFARRDLERVLQAGLRVSFAEPMAPLALVDLAVAVATMSRRLRHAIAC